MARVGDRMATGVRPSTGLVALGRTRAAGHRRTEARASTVAGQVLKADIPARGAISTVTGLLAHVQTAREPLSARERAMVFRVYAARDQAFVTATLAPFLAAALARLLLQGGGLHAGNVARCSTAATANQSGQRAVGTQTLVAGGAAVVRVSHGPTGELLSTRLATQGHGVRARRPRLCSDDVLQRRLAAGTEHHEEWQPRAVSALPKVAQFGAAVVAARQRSPAGVAARVLARDVHFLGARYLLALLAAVAALGDDALARLAASSVTGHLARVDLAVQQSAATFSAAKVLLLATSYAPNQLSTVAWSAHRCCAGGTGTGVALQSAAVRAAPVAAAHLPAPVRHPVPIPLRIGPLAAEADVLLGHRLGHVLTGRAPPSALFDEGSWRSGPLSSALQVVDVVAVGTRPHRVRTLHPLAADHAFVVTSHQLLCQPIFLRSVVVT